jgi:hypothetical protein
MKSIIDFSGLIKLLNLKTFFMLKSIFYIFLIPSSIFLFSCDGNKKTQTEKKPANQDNEKHKPLNLNFANDICDSIGTANFIITKKEARDLTNHYDTTFRKANYGSGIKAPDELYWIDACTITAIWRYLDTLTNADGLRIYLHTYRQLGRNITSIYFVPTTYIDATHHKEIINYKFPLDCSGFDNYFIRTKKNEQQIRDFDSIYRQNPRHLPTAPRDSLSKAVWINKCVFKSINRLIEDNSEYIDGVHIEIGVYKSKNIIQHPGQKHTNQSTFIIVPTHNRVDDLDIIDQAIILNKLKPFTGGAFNHGQLCPQICD